MLPNGVLSTVPVPAAFKPPHDRVKERLIDYELGGRAIQDTSEGLEVKVWTAEADEQTGSIMLSAPGVTPVEFLVVPGVREISLAFDQNMQPAIAYLTIEGAFLYWFDATIPGFTTLDLPAGSRSPRISLDDKRASQTAVSDIVLAYIRGDKLYAREQRDRFTVERELATIARADLYELGQIGMNVSPLPRFQFQLRGRVSFETPQNPTPTISSIEPSTAVEGGGGFKLTVSGAGFVSTSVVRWNGKDRETTFISSTELEAEILSTDVEESGEASVSVVNPSPGGGVSNAVTFTIEEAPPEPVEVVLDEVGSGQFAIPAGVTLLTHLLIVGGGGGGGSRQGGGGGGGSVQLHTDVPVTPETMIAYTVADGGEGGTGGGRGQQGGTSSFGDFEAGGGGGGGGRTTDTDGGSGANGGGGGGIFPGTSDGGTGTDGHDGGDGAGDQFTGGGGGGGAGGPGEDCDASNSANPAGSGGDGIDLSEIFGTDVGDEGWFGAGGGAGRNSAGSGAAGTGGKGGGGHGSRTGVGEAGAPGTGGGGGGSFSDQDAGGKGGSGIIIIRYLA